jgi:hypothetical protein
MAIQTNYDGASRHGRSGCSGLVVLKASLWGVGLVMTRTHPRCYDPDRLSADVLLRQKPDEDEDDEDDPKKEDDDDDDNENGDGYSE